MNWELRSLLPFAVAARDGLAKIEELQYWEMQEKTIFQLGL